MTLVLAQHTAVEHHIVLFKVIIMASQTTATNDDEFALQGRFLLALAWLAKKKKNPVMMIPTSSSAVFTTVPSHCPTSDYVYKLQVFMQSTYRCHPNSFFH